MFNDLAAVAEFCIGGLASFYVGERELNLRAAEIFSFCFLFFTGSSFYVKTMIREKKNSVYKWASWGFHLLLIIGLFLMGYPLLVIAYIPSLIRAIYFYGKSISVMKLGVLEIANSVFFFLRCYFSLVF